MNYLLKSKPKNEHRPKIISVISLFIFLSFFGFLFPHAIRTTSYFFVRPIWAIRSVVVKPFHSITDYFSFKNNLVKEKKILEDELGRLQLKEVDYDFLAKENEDLKKQLGRGNSANRVISHIISKPPLSPYDTLVIDVGSLHDIAIGSKVYLGDNIIIGLIKEVTGNTSIVELFSSGDVQQQSVLLRTGASFTLVGRGGANFQLEVPKDTDILWGDVFVYPGLSSGILGSVYYIDISSQSSFKIIYIRIPGNLFSAQWVGVESQ